MADNELKKEDLKKVVGGSDTIDLPDFDYIVREAVLADKGKNSSFSITDGTYVIKITTRFVYCSYDDSYSGPYDYKAYKDDVLVKTGGEGDFLLSGSGKIPSPWRYLV